MTSLHNYSEDLSLGNAFYRKQVDNYFTWQLDNDFGPEEIDVTSETVIDEGEQGKAEIISKNAGILAGMEEITYFLDQKQLSYKVFFQDGSIIDQKDIVMRIDGNSREILKFERVILNLLQRMSGIATKTKKMNDRIPKDVLLCPTRKTYLGMLDKKAVTLGGGGTHRIGLYDAILVKENHLLHKNISDVVEKIVQSSYSFRFAEIEVENLEQVKELIDSVQLQKRDNILWVCMLDNFSHEDIKKAIPTLKNANIYVELSGNISEENVQSYGELSPHIISSGALTHSIKALDFSLKFIGSSY